MGVASGFNRGSNVVGGAAADLQMAIEVGEAFSCRLLSVTVGEGVQVKRGWISIRRCVGVQWGGHQWFLLV